MSQRQRMRDEIEETDFFISMCHALFMLGFRSFSPNRDKTIGGRNAFHLSMRQAFAWLEHAYDDPDRVVFYVVLDDYGESGRVHSELAFLLSLSYVETWTDQPGLFHLMLEEDACRRRLHQSSIDEDLLMELATRFINEYHLSYMDRTWPPSHDVSSGR